MEKSTISALIVAAGTIVGGILQAYALRSAKRKREADKAKKREEEGRSATGSDEKR